MQASKAGVPLVDSIARNRKRRDCSSSSHLRHRQQPDFHRPRKRSKRLDAIFDRVVELPPHSNPEVEHPALVLEPLRRSSRLNKQPASSSKSLSVTTENGHKPNRTTDRNNNKKDERVDSQKTYWKDSDAADTNCMEREDPCRWMSTQRSRANEADWLPTNGKGKRTSSKEQAAASNEAFNSVKAKHPRWVKEATPMHDRQGGGTHSGNEHPDNGEKNKKVDPSIISIGEKAPVLLERMTQNICNHAGLSGRSKMDAGPADDSSINENKEENKQLKQSSGKHGDKLDAGLSGEGVEANDHYRASINCMDAGNLGEPFVHTTPCQANSKRNEGRRCGLCGGGTDGKPPRKLTCESGGSDNDAYDGSSVSDESNYDKWDGFDNEPGWLGPLLGPIHDRHGIIRVWVHQLCAVWSPEVYFAGTGSLKNVRTALCRGRALKCSRCGRPGATIGCRVDKCPRTYHLSCARAEGSVFDHRKFLIACFDHRHLFQPNGSKYFRWIRNLKARRLKLEIRKSANDASKRDLEAEEKWLENHGEDEEFLKRERRRLNRDLCRIAPIYVGGDSTSGSDQLYEGFESVAGLEGVVQCLKEMVIMPLLYPEFFGEFGLSPPRGVLLHGYPGTGKTLAVRALIGACSRGEKKIAYFARKGADCLGKYVGDAERQLRLLFQVAEKCQPSIVFFDEIDGLAPKRSKHQDQTHCSVVSTLLALLDGLKSRGSVIVIGTTNRPDALDPALRRPGRFDREVHFPLPSMKDRASILALHTQKWPKPPTGTLKNLLAEKTAGFAGADLQGLCTQAAMQALKRNCPFQDLLSVTGRHSGDDKSHSLPNFMVEEQDWLAALASAPPPCSRRDTSLVANDVISWQLHSHLVPCLICPLSNLLIGLYVNEQIWLPSPICVAGKHLKDVIFHCLEEKKIPSDCWMTYSSELVRDSKFLEAIEKILSNAGLLRGFSTASNFETCSIEDVTGIHSKSRELNHGIHTSEILSVDTHNSLVRALGFRVLVTGNARRGQQHLAVCILHGFLGHVVIRKANLAAILQEGCGNMVQGITRIMLKCSSRGICMIYMPRIDVWAFDAMHGEVDTGQQRRCSNAWNAFSEQVDCLGISRSLIILATCEASVDVLPFEVREFFTGGFSNCAASASFDNGKSQFLVELDGQFPKEVVLKLSSKALTQDLIKQYVLLVHQRSHVSKLSSNMKLWDTLGISSQVERHSKMCKDGEATEKQTNWPSTVAPDQVLRVKSNSLIGKMSVLPVPANEVSNDKACIPLVAFGYQILHYPHFSELCWATSKLKEGPYSGIRGPWKGWPFNTCIVHAKSSVNKVPEANNGDFIVRGLVAVGLLACRGVYTSITDVSSDLRKVLELLVDEIRYKVAAGKDKLLFFRLLSQVAYLEDIVNSWAYKLQSSQKGQVLASKHESEPVRQGSNACNIDHLCHAENAVSCSNASDKINSLIEMDRQIELPTDEVNGTFHKVGKDGNCTPPNSHKTVESSAHGVGHQSPKCIASASASAVDSVNSSSLPVSGLQNAYCMPSDLVDKSHCSNESHCNMDLNRKIFISKQMRLSNSTKNDSNNGIATAKSNTCLSNQEMLCLYRCCPQCFKDIQRIVEETLAHHWEYIGDHCDVEDVDDVVETSAALLSSTIRKYLLNGISCNGDKSNGACCCQENSTSLVNTVPRECICHSTCDNPSDAQQDQIYLFRGCSLLLTDACPEMTLHCKFEKLCISTIGRILSMKQPLY